VIINQLTHCTQHPGDDKVGLGWWCWARLWGENNKHLQIISVYCPRKSDRLLTTYQQQLGFDDKKKIVTCPRIKFLQDLTQDIIKWTEEDKVIVLADMNKDLMERI